MDAIYIMEKVKTFVATNFRLIDLESFSINPVDPDNVTPNAPYAVYATAVVARNEFDVATAATLNDKQRARARAGNIVVAKRGGIIVVPVGNRKVVYRRRKVTEDELASMDSNGDLVAS